MERGQDVQAHEVLLEVLAVAAPLGFRRPFLDAPDSTRDHLVANADRLARWHVFLDPVLTAIRAQASTATVYTLTPRERQLLAELGSHLTLREIGDVLGISENTVRTHLKSLYRKLDVTRRRGALEKAGQLGLSGHPGDADDGPSFHSTDASLH
jgi:LuxR family maltose regulon positive regulatory protein